RRRSPSFAFPARGRPRGSRSSSITGSSTATAPYPCMKPPAGPWPRWPRADGRSPIVGDCMSILITKDTTFIIQGITGREAVNMTRECLDYGSKIVGGVTPGRAGRDVYGVPVYDTVKQITARTHVDGSVVAVPPAFTRDAVFE